MNNKHLLNENIQYYKYTNIPIIAKLHSGFFKAFTMYLQNVYRNLLRLLSLIRCENDMSL